MAKKSLKKIFFGLTLIVCAITFGVAAFYVVEVKPEIANRQFAKLKKLTFQRAKIEQRVKVIKKQEIIEKQEAIIVKENEENVNLASLVKEAEKVYGQVEKRRKEGFLWIDRNTSRYVITLGAVNGLIPGNHLTVYEGDQKIGQVTVDTPFDIISYVHPFNDSQKSFTSDYYRVVIE